ncbi:MAG TPA: hypothetical protein VJV23_07150 [Candidatus Polarisedimenticolia bacterium]|nr:hypothetical protein [Candidatus Polarisedimenticolia bacterium]
MSGDRSGVMVPRGQPPPHALFDQSPPDPPGRHAAALRLPGLSIGFEAMDESWHQAFLEKLGGYAADLAVRPEPPTVLYAARRGAMDHFIPPPPPGRSQLNPVFVQTDPDPAAPGHFLVRLCTATMAARFSTAGGRGTLIVSRGTSEPRERSIENILRVTTAWLAVTRGGVLMHSASIEREGRAYLFFGQSGAGKSTLASLSRRGRVVSDDLTLILPGDERVPEAVGSPFRGTYAGGPPVHGRHPVAAGFRLRKAAPGEGSAVLPMPGSRSMASAIANLPFVVDLLHAAPELFDPIDALLRSFPIHLLRFTDQDDSFWDAIEAAKL